MFIKNGDGKIDSVIKEEDLEDLKAKKEEKSKESAPKKEPEAKSN